MFAIFLFIVTFSFYCCIYNGIQQCRDTVPVTNTDSYSSATQAKVTQSLLTKIEAPQLEDVAQETIAPTALNTTRSPFLNVSHIDTVTKAAIDESRFNEQISNLKLRDARIVAKRLELTQKVNGKDKSLDWLQREIRQKLTSDLAVVISAIQQLKAS